MKCSRVQPSATISPRDNQCIATILDPPKSFRTSIDHRPQMKLQQLPRGALLRDQLPDCGQLFFAGAFHFERAESELGRAAGKKSFAQLAQEAVLGICLRYC